jgi:hypothetical protein
MSEDMSSTEQTPEELAQPQGPEKAVVSMRFDHGLLARIDAAARRQGISRTVWLHIAIQDVLAIADDLAVGGEADDDDD